MVFAALDIGSTFIKSAVLDTDHLRVCGFEQIATPPNNASRLTRCEIDGEALFTSVQQALHHLLDQKPDVKGILVCTQMHGYILTDRRFRPVTPYVTWQDRASTEPGTDGLSTLERLQQAIPASMMDAAGVPLKANLAMCSLLARGKAPDDALFCTVGGYLLGRLSGEHVCHLQNAAPTGMTDVVRGAWQTQLIRHAGLDRLVFPRIISGLEPCGTATYRGIAYPLYPDFGDQQACVLGALVRTGPDLNVNIGTAGLISCITRLFERGLYETRPYFENRYLKTISGLSGGRRIDALATRIAKVTGCEKSEVWPIMTGATDNDRWRQEILDVYADIGREYRQAGMRIGDSFARIAFSGGCAGRNPALRAAILRETGIPGATCALGADSMLGLLQLALIACRRAKNIDEAQQLIKTTYGKDE